MSNPNYNKLYWQYARDVLDENIITGKYIKLACQRMFDFAERDDIYFDEEDVDKKIRFVQKMKHSEGKHAGEEYITTDREEIKDLTHYDYDTLMAQFQDYAGLLMQKNQAEYGPKITHIIDKYLGKGKKISETTIEQAEIISLIVTEIKEDLVDKL